MIHTDAGYYTPYPASSGGTGASYRHIWYLKDHLGNNRALVDGSGNAVALHDYDPFGEEIATASSSLPYPFPPGGTESPYMYGGKEWSATTSTYDFEARQFSPSFHRFTTMDPLAEKYYSISPYAYCADDPVNLIDPDGCYGHVAAGAIGGAVLGGLSSGGIAILQRKSVREVIGATIGGAVSGAITGAVMTATFGGAVAVGAVGEGIGSAIEQAIVDHESISIKTIARDAVAGAVGGGLSHGVDKLLLNNIKEGAISSMDAKYASEEVKELLTKEVKKEMSNSGQSLGKAGKRQLKDEVNNRINDLSTSDKAMVEMGYFVTQQTVGNTTIFGTKSLYDFLYDKR
ncbi:MAG: RHS repeat-associated core domain-containing protein [Bacteroidales bacterium]|nr:RHS repeat-associated core domain-containing protein [Bacteroidales bacterium]